MKLFGLVRHTSTTALIALASLVAQPTTAFSAVLQVQDGTLLGAQGVAVLGAEYDVAFVPGSCNDLFSPRCDRRLFAFQTASDADAASQALLDQVFRGAFDDIPFLTRGCSAAGRPEANGEVRTPCSVLTPFAARDSLSTFVSIAENYAIASFPDRVVPLAGLDNAAQIGGALSASVIAVWRPVARPISEPGSLALLGFTAFAFVLASRRSWARKR